MYSRVTTAVAVCEWGQHTHSRVVMDECLAPALPTNPKP